MLNANGNLEMSCVSGSGMPQPYALVQLNENLRAKINDASTRAQVDKALRDLVEQVNKTVEQHEHLQLMVVVMEEWSIEEGLLTPTLKIKRSAVEDRYADKVEGWYAQNDTVVWA
jgi:long-subunit acyl-CoA synthetase (AMP-forming)